MYLETIKKPNDIKSIPPEHYSDLAAEIRQFLIEHVSKTGGHLASNLGVVELTMALHLVLNFPEDKLIWDVGHQTYTHKILTGRSDGFEHLRQFGGMSGFSRRRESDCDAFDTGHSSTSLSVGLGYVYARELAGADNKVISVIGDGALTGGLAYEALNNAARLKSNFIIVLNDNKMSISRNVGGVSRMLNEVRTSGKYYDLKEKVQDRLERVDGGDELIEKLKKTKANIRSMVTPHTIFDGLGITYLGPINGHDINEMTRVFTTAMRIDHAVVIHVVTKKGMGYGPAERYPSKFHGVGPFDVATGNLLKESGPTYASAFSDAICDLAKEDDKIIAITAAMSGGVGLKRFSHVFPRRFFDVGIAEQHAVTFAGAMAVSGLKPVFAVYSSFLQRAYDEMLHDVCLQHAHVVFAIDHAGLVGSDGETHQGIYDISFLSSIPGMTVFAPKNAWELKESLRFALEEFNGPIAIRYPKGEAKTIYPDAKQRIMDGKAEILEHGREVALLAVGDMVSVAQETARILRGKGISPTVVNVRFVRPFDRVMFKRLAATHGLLVPMEDNCRTGGFSEQFCAWAQLEELKCQILPVTLPDAYIEQGSVGQLRRLCGCDAASVALRIQKAMKQDEGRIEIV
ncbi:MAG: 1-deoxy-D-xylulose-5-phosphate synthase [Lachnospiraceae bacterium]|jgi:1-deoxy-D-xylulose-5-phosphate synthase